MKIGYARVSTDAQNLDRQTAALKAAGCELIYSEKASGKNTKDRPELRKAITALNPDDVLHVAEWDRATRSYEDGQRLLAEVGKRDAMIYVLDRPALQLATPFGKAMLGVLSAIAQEERERRQQQAAAGRIHAKARGVKFGRKPKLTPHQQNLARKMLSDGESLANIASQFGVSKSTISRL